MKQLRNYILQVEADTGQRQNEYRRRFNALKGGGKRKKIRPPLRHPWRYRKNMHSSYVKKLKTDKAQMTRHMKKKGTFRHLPSSVFKIKTWKKYPFDPSGSFRLLMGGSKEAREVYSLMYWKDNPVPTKKAFDYDSYPVDVVILKREKAIKFHANDPDWRQVPNKWPIINRGTVVVFKEHHGYSIAGLYLTSDEVPALNHLCNVSVEPCLESARKNLPPRLSFAIQGASKNMKIEGKKRVSQHKATNDKKRHGFVDTKLYGPKLYEKMMQGMIWNDGFGGYMSLTKEWQGKNWYDYFKRNPDITDKEAYDFARFYVELYEIEKEITPPIATYRQMLSKEVDLPSIFPGLHRNMCPVTMAGISCGFGNATHNDSCVKGITETICWCNRNLKGDNGKPLVFACTTARLAYDIGTRPVILFQKGNEMHGTCITKIKHCSKGMVLISKRMTLKGKQRFVRGSITDLRKSSTLRKKGSRVMLEHHLRKKIGIR